MGSLSPSNPLYENTYDTIAMFKHAWQTWFFFGLCFAVALTGLNYFSQQLSKHLSAVIRMLVSTLRVVLVWVISLIMYYCIDPSLGESWGNGSYVKLFGFILLVVGTLMYVRAKDVPLAKDPEATKDWKDEHA